MLRIPLKNEPGWLHSNQENQIIMKKAILVATVGAMTLGVNAGDWGKAPVAQAKAPIEECYDIGGEISAGYMSDYIFFGSRLGRDSVWTDVNYTFDSIVPLTIGAWYLNSTNSAIDPGDELDLYVSAALGTLGGFDVALGYTHYFFPETGAGSQGEIGLDLTRSLGFVDLALETNYNYSIDAWYHQAGIEKSFGLTDSVSLVLGVGIGWSDGYSQNNLSNWNHYYATASLPIELNCRATLTPYVGYNGDPSGWAAIDLVDGPSLGADVLHAGVSLAVSF